MGSAAVYQLSGRGRKVLGLEAFTAAHDQGSSHGQSRIIRQAYFEDPAYVPLLFRSYELWDRLQVDTGADLLHRTGGLMIGQPESDVVSGSLRSAREYALDHELLTPRETAHRFPPFMLAENEVAFYEKKAGYLRPEECIRQCLAQASRRGADLHFGEPMQSWKVETSGEGVTVETSRGTYSAVRLILSTGPWAPEVLAPLGLPITASRRVMFWFDPVGGIEPFLPERFPVYLWQPKDTPVFYGFPATDGEGRGVKVAIHHGDETCRPASIDRTIRETDERDMRSVIEARIPTLNGRRIDARTCMYTMTPDEHFILGPHPNYPQVSIAAGFSGHGFKFSVVVGEILADLAAEGHTRHNIGLFSPQRFATRSKG